MDPLDFDTINKVPMDVIIPAKITRTVEGDTIDVHIFEVDGAVQQAAEVASEATPKPSPVALGDVPRGTDE